MSYTTVTTIYCDSCGHWDVRSESLGPRGKSAAWVKMKALGWKRRPGGEHACPDCAERHATQGGEQ